jgi:hypothetical protein
MSFQLHEWDIHIVCSGTDDASGVGGEDFHPPQGTPKNAVGCTCPITRTSCAGP